MSTVSSSSSMSSALGVTGKGIGGLATGLNTDELVAALTSGTKSKIAKQGQQKQLLNWKMTAYRSMTTALNAFQQKFLKINTSSSSNTNITSTNFFNTYKATSSSNKVTVSAGTNATAGNFTINQIKQLAESESYTSKNKMSTTLSFDINNASTLDADAFKGQTLTLGVDNFTTKNIKLDSLSDPASGVINADGSVNTEQLKTKLQELINEAYKSDNVVKVNRDETTGELSLDSDSARVTVSGSSSLLALEKGQTRSNRVTTNTTVGELDAFKNVQGNVLTFNINGKDITVNKSDTISQMMSKVTNSGANVTMAYDQHNDVFTITSRLTGADSEITMKDVQGNLLSEIFGAQSGNSIGSKQLNLSNSIVFNGVQQIDKMTDAQRKSYASELGKMSFELTINGVTKNIKLDLSLGIGSTKLNNGTYTSVDVYSAINKGIQSAFYGSGVEFGQNASGQTIIDTSKDEAFAITASGEFAAMLGISPDGSEVKKAGNTIYDYGYSNAIKSFDDIGNIDVANLTSNSFEMTINGRTETITVTPAKDKDGNDIALTNDNYLARLNAAVKEKFGDDAAGVSFSAKYEKTPEYKTLTDDEKNKYMLESTDNGDKLAGYYDEKGNRVADVDGIALDSKGNQVVAKQHTTGLKLTLNVPENAVKVTETSVSMSGALVAEMGFAVSDTALVSNNTGSTSAVTLGQLNGGGNMEGGTITLGNGKTVTYDKDTKLNDLLADLNEKFGGTGSAGIKDGKLYIKSSTDEFSIEDSGDLLNNIFGISGGSFETQAASYGDNFKAGINAIYEIDGREFTSSSNNISYNGASITLHQTTLNETTGVHEAIQIGVNADPDDVISRIKEWMDDYNALVYTLNSAINEGKNRNYDPLTDEQKAEMTDDQVKTWETEAKKGLLRNDQTLRQILADMRNAMYTKVEAAGISLYDIGIVTKSGLSDSNQAGQLEFDSNITGGGEARLREMLLNDPDKVRTLFTDSNGIGAKLNTIISQAANESSVDRGSLVRIAGTERLTGDNTSQLGNKVTALDKYIATLKARLETEYNRYWKQFSSLETSVQKMNSQSSWLQSQ